jgi:23S rRNA pseudouridine1911/1915/1917 synthase
MNDGWIYVDRIAATAQGQTVLEYYCDRYSHSSRAIWQDRIIAGEIQLNHLPTTPSTVLNLGQILTYHRPPWQEPDVPLNIDILHDDADVLVVTKPAGLPVLPGGGFVQNTLWWQLQHQWGYADTYPIHRLGRGTSGVLLLAKHRRARAWLSQQMRDHTASRAGGDRALQKTSLQKIYRTLVTGVPESDCFTLTYPIGKRPHATLGYLYAAQADGLPAQSECRVLRRYAQTALLAVQIHTGRPHQIRIHLAAAGFPLVGDPLYAIGGIPHIDTPDAQGDLPVPGDCGYHLHAMQISFVHPQGHVLTITAPPPPILTDGTEGCLPPRAP